MDVEREGAPTYKQMGSRTRIPSKLYNYAPDSTACARRLGRANGRGTLAKGDNTNTVPRDGWR